MAVLSRDDFFSAINGVVGTDSSDETLSFIENMTDTYNDMEKRANGDGVNWEQRYHDLDESWKKKYRSRFFSSGGRSNMPEEEPTDEKKRASSIRIEDLFTEPKKK